MNAVTMMRKNAPRFVSDTEVLVTKAFAKNARIFGTDEYKLWKEIRQDVSGAKMVTKTIKKNANKKTATKNMTYENMVKYIKIQNNAAALIVEFKKQIVISQIQSNPYRSVLAWFMKTFEGYDDYKDFFEKIAAAKAEENDYTAFQDVNMSEKFEDVPNT